MSAAPSTGEPASARSLAATIEQASGYLRRFRDAPSATSLPGRRSAVPAKSSSTTSRR